MIVRFSAANSRVNWAGSNSGLDTLLVSLVRKRGEIISLMHMIQSKNKNISY